MPYENKKGFNFSIEERKEDKDRYKIINEIQELSSAQKKSIILEGFSEEVNKRKNISNYKQKVLKYDFTDYKQDSKQEFFDIKDIRKLYEDKNITTTIILKDIIKILKEKNQKYSLIRDISEIKDSIIEYDNFKNISNSYFCNIYSEGSCLLQNIISNLIRMKILIYNEKEILPKTLVNSFLDILVDISQMMSEKQRIVALLLCIGLSIPFSRYGVKIRISVFGERDSVWLLSKEFSSENITQQLFGLRDALACLKRIQSFPADALRKLKHSFLLKNYDCKYSQILISNLISSQVVDKKIDWNELGQRIIIFGLKSNFDENFIKKKRHLYDNILKVSSSNKSQIHQEFFDSDDIISIKYKDDSKIKNLINVIIGDLLSDNEDKSEIEPKIKIYDNSYNQNQNNNNLELLKEIINENINEENYFSQNKSFSTMNISSKFINNDIPKINNFPNILELEKLSSKDFDKNDNSMEEIILYVRTLLTPLFRKI